jgi:branched-chain amino acid transport system substrate-binding protein
MYEHMAITKIQAVLIAVVVIIAAVGVAAWSITRPPPEETIKFGIVLPLSPPGSYEIGVKMKIGFEIAIEELNAKGGVLGKKVVGIFEDTCGSPEKATAAATKLITQDKVDIILGEFHSSPGRAINEVCHKYNVIFIDSEAWADAITETHYPTIFRIAPYNSYGAIYAADFISKMGWKNVVAMVESTDWGTGINKVIKEKLEALGISYHYRVVELTAKDFTAELTEFKAMTPRPDVLLILQTATPNLLTAKQAFEVGLAPETQILSWSGEPAYPEFWETVGEYGVGEVFMNWYHPKAYVTEIGKAFAEAFKKRTGLDPEYNVMEAYDTVLCAATAIEKAGTTETNAVIKALEELKINGTRGEIVFLTDLSIHPAQWHQYQPPIYVVQYTKYRQSFSDAEIIYPEESKTAEYKPQKEFFGGM